MKGSQRIGAYAALVQGILFIVLLILFAVVLPGQGVTSLSQIGTDAAKAAAVAPILAVISLIVLYDSASVLLVVLALYDRMQAGAPTRMRYAVAGSTIASALFLGQAMLGIVGGRMLGGVTDASLIGPANLAFGLISQSLLSAAVFAASVSSLIWAWAALATKNLPSTLSYVVLLGGVAGIVAIFVDPVQLVQFALLAIWSLWLGYVLMR